MYPLIDLTDKNIIIVGASKGIGKQTALTLSSVGAKCILISRNSEALECVINEMDGSGHGYRSIDVSDIGSIEACVKSIVMEFGPIDGLVYVAGITNDRPINLLKQEAVESTMRLNFGGFIEFVRCVTKRKMYNPSMRIVGVSSTAAFSGTPAHTTYSASKAAMTSAVKCLSRELADKGIALNTVSPSMIRTDMYEKWLDDNGEEGYQVKKLNRMQYLGVGETEDIANAIAFLISPASRFITGTTLVVDGGGTTN